MKKINRNVRVYLISDFFYYSSYDLINAFLTVLITTKVTDGRLDMVGLVLGYYMLLRALAEIPFTKLVADWKISKKINYVSISHVIYGFIVGAIGFSTSLFPVFVFITLMALVDSTYPIKWALFSRMLDKGNEETEWGIEDVLAAIASSIFAIIGGYVSQQYGLSILFIMMGATFSICGIVFHFIKAREFKSKLAIN